MNRSGLKSVGFVGMIVIGAGAVVLPLAAAALLGLVASARALPTDRMTSLWAALAALSAILGVWLIAQGVGGLRGRPSRPARLPMPVAWIVLFALAAGALAAAPDNALVVGAASVLAALFPGLALLSLVSRRLSAGSGPPTWRQVAAQTGATLTLSLWWSMALEIIVLVGLAMAAGIAVGAATGDPGWFLQWSERWADPSSIAGGELFQQPEVLAFLLILLSGFVPVIEEIGKLLAVGALALARRPSRVQAVMGGITCGATFSVYEAALANPLGGTGAMIAVMRVGALLVHCCAACMTALGLWEWISQHRARYFFLSLGLSIGLHAAWNALAISLSAAMTMDAAAAVAAQVIALSALSLLSLGAAYVLARITKPALDSSLRSE